MLTFNPRQQQAVTFTRNTVVNASAGTGKTATLVGAYLSQLAQGIPPGQIVAITFTEKAAAEMRDRLKREVLARVSGVSADGGPGLDWRRVLTGLANAPISTIHAFCAGLLKENPLEAGVDPHFVIWDEDESSAVRRSASSKAPATSAPRRAGRAPAPRPVASHKLPAPSPTVPISSSATRVIGKNRSPSQVPSQEA